MSQPPAPGARGPLPPRRGEDRTGCSTTEHPSHPFPHRPRGGCSGTGNEEAARCLRKRLPQALLLIPSTAEGHSVCLLEPAPAPTGDGGPCGCMCCLQGTEDLETTLQQCPRPRRAGQEVLQRQGLSRHPQCPKMQPATGGDAAAMEALPGDNSAVLRRALTQRALTSTRSG